MNNIVLIGFMGSGKTTIAKELANNFSLSLVDTDDIIVNTEKMKISDIFSTKGEPYFRLIEKKICGDLQKYTNSVIATGGGIVISQDNRKQLQKSGRVYYLKVNAQEVINRLQGDTTRPLLNSEDKLEKVTSILKNRENFYKETAHKIINTNKKTVNTLVQEIWEDFQDNRINSLKAGNPLC